MGVLRCLFACIIERLRGVRVPAAPMAGDPRGPLWSEGDLNYLRREYARTGTKEIAQRLGRSEMAIRVKANRLELSAPRKRRLTPRARRS